ncbi:glycine zipper family protein [Ferrimonas balearica]|uniref:glycine zipper family protein n=1 Tax=Ferrimonas balearica TaxID=44012 RepID=UPI001C9994F7|nr:glycine zipper family protein [Ferrimonas balearica]MBY5991007.1 glycine zipper family protein [Ferrimonas balearica]
MNKTLLALSLVLIPSLASANVIIDTHGVEEKDYVYDLHQCNELAAQVEKEQVSGGAVSGAARGAALGAAAGAISGNSGSEGAKYGAAAGVVGGALNRGRNTREAEQNHQQQRDQVVRNCMTNRGYTVLN